MAKMIPEFLRKSCPLKKMNALLVVDVGLLILVVLSALLLQETFKDDVKPSPKFELQSLCVPCKNFTHPAFASGLGPLSGNFTTHENNNKCCPKTENDVLVMLSEITQYYLLKKSKESEDAKKKNCQSRSTQGRTAPPPTIAIRLAAKENTDISDKQGLSVIKWDMYSENSFWTDDNLEYEPYYESVLVNKEGFYKVHSQVTFRWIGRKGHSFRPGSFSQLIFHERYGERQCKMKSSESRCSDDHILSLGEPQALSLRSSSSEVEDPDLKEEHITTLAGGVFHLKRGDRILVQTYTPDAVVASPHVTHISIFKV